jgi:hypothetical protein
MLLYTGLAAVEGHFPAAGTIHRACISSGEKVYMEELDSEVSVRSSIRYLIATWRGSRALG